MSHSEKIAPPMSSLGAKLFSVMHAGLRRGAGFRALDSDLTNVVQRHALASVKEKTPKAETSGA